MYRITKEEWEEIPKDYKSEYVDYDRTHTELVGARTVLGGCIDQSLIGILLVEGVHFIIVDDK